jgi:3-hydroxybenzoate 6-monooxygenase
VTSSARVARLIVGGGIGGLATALGLARAGLDVCVLERAPRLETVGAGIQFGPNATRVLDGLGVLQALMPAAVCPRELVYMDALSGERITSLDLGAEFLARYGHPYVVVHRGDVQQVLLEACTQTGLVTLQTDRAVAGVDDRGDHARVTFADGVTIEADLVVGGDGVNSVVRAVISADEPRCEGFVAYRGTIPIDEVAVDGGVDSMVMWVAPGIHMVQYKVSGGRLYNQVGAFQSRRFLAGEDDWGTPEELDEAYGVLCHAARHAASLLERGVRYPMRDREPLTAWSRNRVTLLGDAAHPMLPVLAQGGCQALEDAWVLARKLAEHADVTAALKAYDDERAPRAGMVQRQARRFADVCHISGVGVELRNALFAQHRPDDYAPLDWLYAPAGVAVG